MDIKTLCLGVLSIGDASGYEIKKVFEGAFSHFYVAGFGSIYPALAELSHAGYVTCNEQEQEKRPAKKVYHLTDKGRQAFHTALLQTYPSHRVRSDFMVLLMFSHLLTSGQVAELLRQRVFDIDKTLLQIDKSLSQATHTVSPGAEFAAGYARTILKAGRDYILQQQEDLLRQISSKDT